MVHPHIISPSRRPRECTFRSVKCRVYSHYDDPLSVRSSSYLRASRKSIICSLSSTWTVRSPSRRRFLDLRTRSRAGVVAIALACNSVTASALHCYIGPDLVSGL